MRHDCHDYIELYWIQSGNTYSKGQKYSHSWDVEIKGSIFPILLNTCYALFENVLNNNVNISVHLLHNHIIYINVYYNIQLQCIFIICINIWIYLII